ncbi:MAG: YlbF family regulator [Oscillospiraceae bacterium]|jgi:cell fate (sporulation/competence/biofilm development) regulator YlbF (YheA/YmcA/DUF963 family)|nr:YlbF family regulator [Oscillospiraceae bacterium]
MDPIAQARELGKAIQADKRYKAFEAARIANDNDSELQQLIGEFNLSRQNLQLEMMKPEGEKSAEKTKSLNERMQTAYAAVMKNTNMSTYNHAKSDFDFLVNEIQQIVALCCDGDDPETCTPSAGCAGSCATCGGCG